MSAKYDAVIFDLLTGLIDSWSLWNDVAGSVDDGTRWRHHYLRLTYDTGDYVPYEDLVLQAARESGVGEDVGNALIARWDELQPWPEAHGVLTALKASKPLAIVTNCSLNLGNRAVSRTGIDYDVVVIAEEAGAYKPDPRPYRMALERLKVDAGRALFIAGSAFDVNGAGRLGMPVYWHNKAGLPMPGEGTDALIAEERSLDPLKSLVLNDS